MYTDDDLQRAVTDGVLDQASIERLQTYLAQSRDVVLADEERFRLVSSFNDIFVLVASVMLIFGAANAFGGALSALACAGLAWLLAEVFTKSRRMASPSIVYAAIVSIAPAIGVLSFLDKSLKSLESSAEFYVFAGAAALAAACAALFWKRFQVPIALTLFWAGLIVAVYMFLVALTGGSKELHVPFFLASGLIIFSLAMRYDMKDVKRVTVSADIAFWLHLLAASLIVHTVFQLIEFAGVQDGLISSVIVFAAFFAFVLIALVIDRRATLVSAALYVVAALVANFKQFGISEDNSALSLLMVGTSLLVLSWGWSPLRQWLLALLPNYLTTRVPAG